MKSLALTVEQYAEAKALPVGALRDHGLSDVTYQGHPAVKIAYFDEAGQEGPVRFRRAMFKADQGPDVRFIWRRNSRPTLYGLRRLKEAIRVGYVVLVEGESDCHTLWHHGIPALGVPGETNTPSPFDDERAADDNDDAVLDAPVSNDGTIPPPFESMIATDDAAS